MHLELCCIFMHLKDDSKSTLADYHVIEETAQQQLIQLFSGVHSLTVLLVIQELFIQMKSYFWLIQHIFCQFVMTIFQANIFVVLFVGWILICVELSFKKMIIFVLQKISNYIDTSKCVNFGNLFSKGIVDIISYLNFLYKKK